jgi:hypothetical protein
MWMESYISTELAAPNFRVEMDMEAVCCSETSVSTYSSTRHNQAHNINYYSYQTKDCVMTDMRNRHKHLIGKPERKRQILNRWM